MILFSISSLFIILTFQIYIKGQPELEKEKH